MRKKLLLLLTAMVLPLATWAADGDQFTITTGDVTLTYRVISEESKTVMVGKGTDNLDWISWETAISVPDNWSGTVTIPETVENNSTTYTVVEIADNAFVRTN